VAAAPATGGSGGRLIRDAVVTIATRFGLAILLLATDVILARSLGPAAKGRFTLVVLYSQLAALVLGWGIDQALAVIAGRGTQPARRGLSTALIWIAIVGGFGVVLSCWLYGLPSDGPPSGPATLLLPNLSADQFVFAALAIPAEMLFSIGLFALLGRAAVVAYSGIRIVRAGVLVALIGATVALATLSLDLVLVLNLLTLVVTGVALLVAASRLHILGGRPSAALLEEQLRFGTRALPGTLAERLQFRADSFLLNILIGVRATGIYSVTSGIAETLWYVPNALGLVMLSRAVDPHADAGRIAAALTRVTIAVAVLLAIPTFVLGPRLVRIVYGSTFTDAGVALRLILPGVVAYSIVAVLSRYLTGRGRPGTTTLIMLAGLATNVVANLVLIPRLGISGAAIASSISYGLTAILALAVFRQVSGRGIVETLVVRPSDLRAAGRAAQGLRERWSGRAAEPLVEGLDERAVAELDDLVVGPHQPGDER
jgi:O-antigen/teichoic acid export membrane protein